VFPVSSELPVSLEFFGEDLEKLREFDPATQRSLDPIEVVRLTPSGYGPLIASALREAMPDGLEQLLSPEALEQLLEGGTPEGLRRLMGLAWPQPASLLDYLPAATLVAIDERRACLAHGQQWFDHVVEHHAETEAELGLEPGTSLPPVQHRPPADTLAEASEGFTGFDLVELHESDNHANSFDLASRPVPAYPTR
jgi:transcription-repair coupling factor (superfamily II helicase)